jgi:hypothetical protein
LSFCGTYSLPTEDVGSGSEMGAKFMLYGD